MQTSRQGRVNRTIPIRFSFDEGLDVGKDTGTPVTNDYSVSFTFTGGIEKVTSDIKSDARAAIDAWDKANQQAAVRKALRN